MKNTKNIKSIQIWLFIGLLAILFLVWIILNIYGKPEEQYGTFFDKGNNYMADLFNVMYYSKDRAPYVSTINDMAEKAYFPLSYVICYVLAAISNLNWYLETEGELMYNGRVQSLNSMPIVIGVFFICILLMLAAWTIYELIEGRRIKKVILTACMMMSGVMMFTYERGNLILLALSGMVLFLLTYESEVKWLREIGYLGLAVAGALKGYPAILGIILIYRHEWKEVLRLVIYGVVMAFGPFLLLKGGFSNIPIWLDNLHQNSEFYMFLKQQRLGYLYFISCMENASREDVAAEYNIWKPIIACVGIYGIATSLFQSKRWLQVCTLLTFILIYPSNSGYYCLIYLIPVIIMYLNEKDVNWKDLIYLPIFVVLMTPLQWIRHESNYTIWLDNILIMALLGICLIDNTVCMIRSIRNRSFAETIKKGNTN